MALRRIIRSSQPAVEPPTQAAQAAQEPVSQPAVYDQMIAEINEITCRVVERARAEDAVRPVDVGKPIQYPSFVAVAAPLAPAVSIRDACALAGIARRTMYYWIAKGLVRTHRVASGRLRVEVASLFKETAA